MTPSNANTSGLEVVQWEYRTAPHRQWHITDSKAVAEQETKDGSEVVPRLVRAASAQARIDAAEARADRLAKALEAVRDLGSDGEHSGDGHARCRSIARAALQQETQP